MPNEVYEAAVEGLGSLVSPRVAKRIIDDSLRATSRTPDDVSRSAMRRLLLGRIRKELEGVMPAAAVGPGLKNLAAALEDAPRRERRPWWRRGGRSHERQEHTEEVQQPGERRVADRRRTVDGEPVERRVAQRRKGPASAESIGVKRSSVYLPDVPLPHEPSAEPARNGPSTGAGASSPGASAAVAEPVVIVDSASEPHESRPGGTPQLPTLTPALVERALRSFSELETVRQIVAVENGVVLSSSGEGLEAERLQGLSVATIALLSKAGTLRVFSLENAAGVLFLFPMRNGAIVVLTKPKVNIGAVLSARAALEEAA